MEAFCGNLKFHLEIKLHKKSVIITDSETCFSKTFSQLWLTLVSGGEYTGMLSCLSVTWCCPVMTRLVLESLTVACKEYTEAWQQNNLIIKVVKDIVLHNKIHISLTKTTIDLYWFCTKEHLFILPKGGVQYTKDTQKISNPGILLERAMQLQK